MKTSFLENYGLYRVLTFSMHSNARINKTVQLLVFTTCANTLFCLAGLRQVIYLLYALVFLILKWR